MGKLTPTTLAIHQWIRDDAPVSMKLVITPVMIAALADRIDAAHSEGQPSGYDSAVPGKPGLGSESRHD